MTALAVTVLGTPVPQGSMRSLGPKRLVHSNAESLRPWRDTVAWQVRDSMVTGGLSEPLTGPLHMSITFTLPRPKSAPKARWAPDRKPDIDKLLRALLDACTAGGAWADDAQVVSLTAAKVYATPNNLPGVTFVICTASARPSTLESETYE